MDFAFIQARIAGPTDAYSEERKKRFSNPESKATELINKYRVKLAENPNLAEFIVKESNSDEEMTFINAQESNEIKNDFMIDSPLYLTDKGFNTFLFSQKANAVSSPYAVKGANGEVFAYVIVMPIKITQGKFQSFDDLYKQKITLFMF